MTPRDSGQDAVLQRTWVTLARLSQRPSIVLAVALGAGCLVAAAFRVVVAGRGWEATAQGIGFFLGLLGLVMGVMLAYGGRGSLSVSHRDRHGDRLGGAAYPARPLVGLAEALFCLPTIVVTLTM